LKKYDDAIAAYKKAIIYDNYNGPAFYNLGNAYYMKGELDKSINSY